MKSVDWSDVKLTDPPRLVPGFRLERERLMAMWVEAGLLNREDADRILGPSVPWDVRLTPPHPTR